MEEAEKEKCPVPVNKENVTEEEKDEPPEAMQTASE